MKQTTFNSSKVCFVVLCAAACIPLPGGVCYAQPSSELNPQIAYSQSGVQLSLVAEHPTVVTPTGIDVDPAGKVWVVASHTHFRPEQYEGPAHDEVVVIGVDGSRSVYYQQTDATMDLELGPDEWVYLAERDRILRVKDSDGDGRGDVEQDIAVLATEADYPHNGLSGLCWHPSGDLLFSLGENYWRDWTLTSSDQKVLAGTGEGGVFRCRPDGSGLRRIAKGFWNPFGVCARSDGTMFVAENDPGSRPPCRLLHLVEGGDYGYQRLYGESPFHPFVCWDGELRGTLPMLHPVGEAPCGIAALGNGLIVPSWTDHRIDFYPLKAEGASFQTQRVNLVRGGRNFRPTCIAQASPTLFYLADWVYGSYQLHGRGRVWKLDIDVDQASWLGERELRPRSDEAELAARLRDGSHALDDSQLFALARSKDAFIRRAAIDALAVRAPAYSAAAVKAMSEDDQITTLLALRISQPNDVERIRSFLASNSEEIQFETLRWIADEKQTALSPEIESLLGQANIEFKIYEACLATWNTLSGNPRSGVADAGMLMARISDPHSAPHVRAYALRLLDPQQKQFSPKLWEQLYSTGDRRLLIELTRALVASGSSESTKMLTRIATDPNLDSLVRGDAIAGLPRTADGMLDLLIELSRSSDPVVRGEALRSIRFAPLDVSQRQQLNEVESRYPEDADLLRAALNSDHLKRSRPAASDIEAWQQRLAEVGAPIDLNVGRRVFSHQNLAGCNKCHRHQGRGNVVGPDLSAASNRGDPDRLLRALLQPSHDVDPQYFPRMLITEDGTVFTGIMLRDGGGGQEVYRDALGRERKFRTAEIVERKELTTSMMPDGLVDTMTLREIRDLLAFLDQSAPLGGATTERN